MDWVGASRDQPLDPHPQPTLNLIREDHSEAVLCDLLHWTSYMKIKSLKLKNKIPSWNTHTHAHIYIHPHCPNHPQPQYPETPKPACTPPALFQNGVVSLIDCTLLEDPESTEEEGRCGSCSHRYTHAQSP